VTFGGTEPGKSDWTLAVNTGHWDAFKEGTTVRCSGDCWYVEYDFQIVDAEGKAHQVRCERDVDMAAHTAVPRNEQAQYYWTSKR
jgi:hypothetical protein